MLIFNKSWENSIVILCDSYLFLGAGLVSRQLAKQLPSWLVRKTILWTQAHDKADSRSSDSEFGDHLTSSPGDLYAHSILRSAALVHVVYSFCYGSPWAQIVPINYKLWFLIEIQCHRKPLFPGWPLHSGPSENILNLWQPPHNVSYSPFALLHLGRNPFSKEIWFNLVGKKIERPKPGQA